MQMSANLADASTEQNPVAKALLAWFSQNKRFLPFRQEPSSYHVWVSEIMLQQTRVTAVLSYYERFIRTLPTPAALASCEPDTLRKLWEGLGYYNRVMNMQKTAKIVCERFDGNLPRDYQILLTLPGIGIYTAGAIASIAFGMAVPAVDGNVLRVFARLYNDSSDITLPATKRIFKDRVMALMPKDTPGPYNESLMELGALVCVPGTPRCANCPLSAFCKAHIAGTAERLPKKPPKPKKLTVPVTAALIESEQGLLLQRRPSKGLLAGMWQPFTVEKALNQQDLTSALHAAGVPADLTEPLPPTKHVFTHRIWMMSGWRGVSAAVPLSEGLVWANPAEMPIPSAFSSWLDGSVQRK